MVVKLLKDGDKQLICNYRSIRLLSAVSKIIEKLMHNKLYTSLSPTLSHKQQVFRWQQSTASNVLHYLHKVFTCFDFAECNYLESFYVDFQKSFEEANHHLLLEKLSSPEKHGSSLKLLESYLIGRNQTIRIAYTWTAAEYPNDLHSGLFSSLFLWMINLIGLCPRASGTRMTSELLAATQLFLSWTLKEFENGVEKIQGQSIQPKVKLSPESDSLIYAITVSLLERRRLSEILIL